MSRLYVRVQEATVPFGRSAWFPMRWRDGEVSID